MSKCQEPSCKDVSDWECHECGIKICQEHMVEWGNCDTYCWPCYEELDLRTKECINQ